MKQINQITNGTSATLLNSMIQEKKNQGIKLYNMAAGDPNLPLPAAFKGGLDYCSKNGFHNYTESQGLYILRKRIDNPENVIITNGAKQLLYMTLMATCKPGDEVVILGPCWSSYFEICKMLLLNVKYTTQISEISYHTSAVLFNNPNNPTGRVYNAEFCRALQQQCKKVDCWLISDEIYADLIYDDIDFYSLKNQENVIFISGFSKNLSLSGWRFGYAVGEKAIIDQITLIQSQISGPPNTIMQYAIEKNWGYFQYPDKNIYKERRDIIAANNELFTKYKPAAGFYFYIPVKGNSFNLCQQFLNEHNIIFTPGDEYGIPHTIRISFAAIDTEDLKKIKPILDIIN